jgi:DNA adenine methylase
MREVVARNGLLDGHYAEAYAGGAAIAWSLLFSDHVQHVHINDLDPAIHAFWESVLFDTDALCELIWRTRVTMTGWRRQRAVLDHPNDHTRLQRGFATFFLNRTNRSGIIRGGVIGGKQQTGTWKLDARYNKLDLTSRIQRIARYRERVTLTNYDALWFIRAVAPSLPAKSLLYLDPPYYVKGDGLYEHHYGHQDHVQIAHLVSGISVPAWVVSYDSAPQVLAMYRGFRRRKYDLKYSAQECYDGSEVIFFSPSISIPKTRNPANMAA